MKREVRVINRIARREIRRDVLLKRIITFLHVCLIIWCRIVERKLVVIMITLLLLITFSIFFSAITCYNGLCSYLYNCVNFNIVTIYIYYSDNKLKCLWSAVLTTFRINMIRELICFIEKSEMVI